MTGNHHTARHYVIGGGIVAGAVAVTFMVSAPVARADDSTTIDPIGLLEAASANLTEANTVVSGLDFPDYSSLFGAQTSFQDTGLDLLDRSIAVQEPFLSSLPDDSFFEGSVIGYFRAADLALNYASHAVLQFDQAFDTDTPLTGAALDHALFNLAAVDLGLLDAEFFVLGPDIIAGFSSALNSTGDIGDALLGSAASAAATVTTFDQALFNLALVDIHLLGAEFDVSPDTIVEFSNAFTGDTGDALTAGAADIVADPLSFLGI